MTHLRKLTAVLLAVIMVFALAACGQKDDTAVDKDLTVNVVALNGTTGFGMAKLMSDSKAGTTALSYNFTVETDPSNATAALVNGTADIAALPTNAAAALYNKTDGAVQVLALNTRGVLYVVTDGTESITSFADLRGKNVYVPVQNPTFIFQYLCEKNGLTVGTDITIDNTYAQPAELNTALASGGAHRRAAGADGHDRPRGQPRPHRRARPDRRVGQGRPGRQPRAGLRRRAQGVCR